jgi:hypothetical protein
MARGPGPDYRQSQRCKDWKTLDHFHLDMALPESRHVCRACFARERVAGGGRSWEPKAPAPDDDWPELPGSLRRTAL